jgi:hypothetical protein
MRLSLQPGATMLRHGDRVDARVPGAVLVVRVGLGPATRLDAEAPRWGDYIERVINTQALVLRVELIAGRAIAISPEVAEANRQTLADIESLEGAA